ncbi:PD-(D/E)XK nuclease family transposase (macronuclear) [Tetrahymena thermophila SB210]|uniref:PD-(D/E)XK nuclease family transposase n=1 Tax=Tetrahymena thermophila (strain SB210) TaxID=312017 RepID=I7M4A7_TETTS|nr:PD-(D/E)XK nuclease family transposase [Tetrahymena thermophila SB210]EAS06118.1 PD-(D/E)XK nuclease family transposase [Tetrahymena thermophila SB210]|eukprot:XP_001026363.1 PD-(D/E)XK nuclease family transposase [Tetrahymena thermophila SB210]
MIRVFRFIKQNFSFQQNKALWRAKSRLCADRYDFSSNQFLNKRFYSKHTDNQNNNGQKIIMTSDFVFEKIFSNHERMKSFLESVLVGKNKILHEEINEVIYLNNNLLQNSLTQEYIPKKSMFDLQIKTSQGTFIVEIYKRSFQPFLKRIQYYSAQSLSQQQNQTHTSLKPIISIAIVDDILFEDDVPCISFHKTIEQKTQKVFLNYSTYVFIELGKYDNKKYDQSCVHGVNEKEWLDLLKKSDIHRQYKTKEVLNAAQYAQFIQEKLFDEYVKHKLYEDQFIEEIKNAKVEGIQQGQEETIKLSKHYSIKAGKEEVVKQMLKDGLSLQKIITYTGLSKEEIDEIK